MIIAKVSSNKNLIRTANVHAFLVHWNVHPLSSNDWKMILKIETKKNIRDKLLNKKYNFLFLNICSVIPNVAYF